MKYVGNKTNEISFPLGGIGAGCIGLAGNGRLIDWEIYNRPNKGGPNGYSHFAVKAEQDGKLIDARILNGDLHSPYSGRHTTMFKGFGWGPEFENLVGMPHFRNHEFIGGYPFAKINFSGEILPGQVSLNAWSPFIPTNDRDSSLPSAIFEVEITNDTDKPIDYTVVGALSNPFGKENAVNTIAEENGLCQLTVANTAIDPQDRAFGDITLTTDAPDVSYQQYWYRGAWSDDLETYWRQFTENRRFENRTYDSGVQNCWTKCDTGHIAAHFTLAANETRKVKYAITWNVPNCKNYWVADADAQAEKYGVKNAWKNYYATQWSDSKASSQYLFDNYARLCESTKLYHDTLFNSSLPPEALDAVSATASVLKSPTCLRLEDGTFYGWEGSGCVGGCCEGSCTHVWNYSQALAFLFPALERSMRTANYTNCVDEVGGSHFRIKLPLGIKAETDGFRPCADGQFGDIIKTYRDWKISGDTDWLKSLWPAMKKTIEYAWSDDNYDKWDPEQTGVLHGRQHHTLDMELFGPNAWLTGYYLAALKAGAEMAIVMDEPDFAEKLTGLFNKGKAWTDKHLFNGKYYIQQIDLSDKSILDEFNSATKAINYGYGNASDQYWSEEFSQIKYQVDQGCQIDMTIAQWHANLYGLGEILDPGQTRKALKATFDINFKPSARDHYNPWRIYALNDESTMNICAWPDDTTKPAFPVIYASEEMHGFAYAAAIHMIQAGLADEGMTIIKAIREKYDGRKRNPWNEIECGSNYARSMASYSLLNAFSGFSFDMPNQTIGFDPIDSQTDHFRCFWSLDSGWGEFEMTEDGADLKILYGTLKISNVTLPLEVSSIMTENQEVKFSQQDNQVCFEEMNLTAGQSLKIRTNERQKEFSLQGKKEMSLTAG